MILNHYFYPQKYSFKRIKELTKTSCGQAANVHVTDICYDSVLFKSPGFLDARRKSPLFLRNYDVSRVTHHDSSLNFLRTMRVTS